MATVAQLDPKRNANLPEFQEYKINTQVIRKMLIQFCDLDRHVIIIAQEEYEKEEGTNRRYWGPAVTPKLAKTVFELVDVAGRLSVEDSTPTDKFECQMQTVLTSRVQARSRIRVPAVVTNPVFNDFLGKERVKL